MAKKNAGISVSDDWRVQEDLRTLTEAKAIEKDPKRLKACQELAKKRLVDMACVIEEGSDK